MAPIRIMLRRTQIFIFFILKTDELITLGEFVPVL